ncbi:hypothetical protein ACH46N_28210 [Streptomyces pristinaespiralis]|uniref:Predicted protein n=2 Tax=Streptomyces pristinaespiralis TaxID=38300 RepID=B5H9I6_STRE2|nr:hypothetical protein [Streptomyces pristinaespiralis]ALC24177.1 hypothetical protein SPRI_5871 [Streptomyces pristinaespiralis]EDY63497.1 predicted protein [Streptomyces pristinaespiralis ATCC 25486]QMU13440.1 hypothetical protein H3L99_07410 [Streptomyces pristinaespiralis]
MRRDRAGEDRLQQDRGFPLLFPVPSIVLLVRQDTGRDGPDAAGAAVATAPPGLQSRR